MLSSRVVRSIIYKAQKAINCRHESHGTKSGIVVRGFDEGVDIRYYQVRLKMKQTFRSSFMSGCKYV